MHEIRVGSLFSGIGGIEIGLERAGGFRTLWFVEKEEFCQKILRREWPDAEIYDNVETVDFGSLPRVDVLTGGFPCQDISNAGKRAGIEGSRSGLWSYCVEAIVQLRPRVAFFENVAALTHRGLDRVLCDLAEIGYDAEWHCIPASSVGAYHQRDRIVILAYADSERWNDRIDHRGERHVPDDEEWDDAKSESEGDGRQHWTRQDGEARDVADATCERCGETGKHCDGSSERASCSCQDVVDAIVIRSSSGSRSNEHQRTSREEATGVVISTSEKRERRQAALTGSWFTEPNVGRVADGIPNRVDRLRALGNAVVPAWAEAVGKAIKEEALRW